MVALASMSQPVGTLIVGGGIAGCALAYYLAQEGETDVLLVEADELGSGSTGGSFGGVRQQFSTPLEIELSRRGLDFWRTAERVLDSPVPWHENGYLFMSGNADIVAKLAEAAKLQRSMGLTDVDVLDVEQIKELTPWVGTDGLLGAACTAHDGKVTPTDGVSALAKAARARGVRIREHWDLKSLEKSGSGWRVAGPEVVDAGRVVLCTGYWSSDLLRAFGLELTIHPVPLYAAITEPALAGQLVPLTIDLDTGLLIERESGGLLIAVLLEENPPGYGHAQMRDHYADLSPLRAPAVPLMMIGRRSPSQNQGYASAFIYRRASAFMCSRHPSSVHETTRPVMSRWRYGLRGSTIDSATAGRSRMLAAFTRSTRTSTRIVSPSWSIHSGVTCGVPSTRMVAR